MRNNAEYEVYKQGPNWGTGIKDTYYEEDEEYYVAHSTMSVVVSSFDWGASGKIKATLYFDSDDDDKIGGPDDFSTTAEVEAAGGTWEYARIPYDYNPHDLIQDAWENTHGVSSYGEDDDDDPEGDGTDGDRLVAFEEYRGFAIQGAWTDTDPEKKDVFVRDFNDQILTAYPDADMDFDNEDPKAPVHWIKGNEYKSNLIINRYYDEDEPHIDQKVIKVQKVSSEYVWFGATHATGKYIPYNLNYCYVDVEDFESGPTLIQAVNPGDTVMNVTSTPQPPGKNWKQPGHTRVDDELIPYNTKTETQFEGCKPPNGIEEHHDAGKIALFYPNVADTIRRCVGHECGHAVHIDDDDEDSIMTRIDLGVKDLNHTFRQAGPVKGSLQEFAVK